MPEQMRAYIVSLMAFSPLADYEGEGPGVYVEHRPAFVPAYSMQEAADRCRENALATWPLEQGWYNHQAAVMPVPKAFYEATIVGLNAGIIDTLDDTEPQQVFNLT